MTCIICGSSMSCFSSSYGGRPKDYCSLDCRNISKHLRLFESSLDKIELTDKAKKALKARLFRICNQDLRTV